MKSYKFSDLYAMSSGISTKPEQAGHGAPFLSFKTVFNSHFLPDALTDLMATTKDEQAIYSIQEGDIFLTRTSETLNELGMSSVAVKDYPKATFSGFLKRVRPKQTDITYHKFMAFYLRSDLFRKTMTNNAIMTLRASLNEQIFSYLDLLLPPFEEQKKIGDLLFSIHEKIELNNRIIAELEQMAKTLYDYWFVQFDFPDANEKPYKSSGGKMLYNEILKREIPEGWEVKGFSFFDIYQSQTISEKEMINDGEYFVFGANGIVGKYDKYNHEESEIVVTCRGNSCGNILRTIPKSWITGNAMVIKSTSTEMHSEFIFQMLHWAGLSKIITGSGQPQITRTNIETLKFILPSSSVLIHFSDKIKSVVDRKYIIFQQNQQLAALRDWLLPMLMNGQVTVNDSGASYEADALIAATPQKAHITAEPLNIPANKKAFAKQVLAGKIVAIFIADPNFTEIKFQKVQFLAEHLIEADLNLNYYYQAAGPYDNRFMHTIYDDFRKQKWFDCKDKQFIPMENQGKIEEYYLGYFAPAQSRLSTLFEILNQLTEAETEIIATLYAVWNNRIIEARQTTDEELIADFYKWSDRKQRYSIAQIESGLQFLKMNQIQPRGFGQLLKRAKSKK
ncbi:restriction endonuclease subunit S [Mucilaginibacter sp. 22184]|uniref:restriction endonuclease subunit S n=1 Tax=Mucilaginibacter sp. 22184 TaxID=3453887 RepID=UPI003F82FD2F